MNGVEIVELLQAQTRREAKQNKARLVYVYWGIYLGNVVCQSIVLAHLLDVVIFFDPECF